jgi:hypothetical protein
MIEADIVKALHQLSEATKIGFEKAFERIEKLEDKVANPQPKAEKQEPVGQMCIGCGSSWSDERLAQEKKKSPQLVSCCPERKMVSVFTHPQPKREWIGLTDEEVVKCQQGNIWHFYSCIEAKLKEKNT